MFYKIGHWVYLSSFNRNDQMYGVATSDTRGWSAGQIQTQANFISTFLFCYKMLFNEGKKKAEIVFVGTQNTSFLNAELF